MRLLLIQPNPQFTIAHILPKYVSEESGTYPPLGLLYLAAAAERDCNAKVQIVDNAALKLGDHQLEQRIRLHQPLLVGITVTSFTLLESLKIARLVKSIDPGIHVCMGGPHPTIYPEETVRFPTVDSVVMGEGEHTLPEIINRLAAGLDLHGIPGITYKNKREGIKNNGPREFITNLDTLPFPARHLIVASRYRSLIGEQSSFTTMISSRGCRYNCLFCYHSMGRNCRTHSTEYLLQEIRHCRTQGYRDFWFFDDNFITSRQRVMEFCQELKREGQTISWHIRTRLDNLDHPLIETMASAGCKRISIGIESASPRVLKVLRKETDLTKARQKIAWLRESGIKSYLDFIIGSPGETSTEIKKTVDFAKNTNPDYVQFALLIPYPQTDLYQHTMQRDLYHQDPWLAFAQAPVPYFKPPLANHNFSRKSLMGMVVRAYRSFYWRPKFILKQLGSIRSMIDLFYKSKAALRLLIHHSPWQ